MRKYFITGLVVWLPLALTLFIFSFIVNLMTKPFVGLAESWLSQTDLAQNGFLIFSGDQLLRLGSQGIILILLFLFTVILGFLGQVFLLNSLIRVGNALLHRIPLVNKVYKTSQDVIQTIFQKKTDAFTQVVLVPFPTSKSYSLGLITRNSPPEASEAVKTEMQSVFVPTTPNPTSGFLLMIQQKDMIPLNMAVEDAVKYIISCGVIHPETADQLIEEYGDE